MILKVNQLSYACKTKEILSAINFSLHQGEILAVLGPNGAGKTTLLKCLNRILPFQHGEVQLWGTPTTAMSPRQIARKIAYVAQQSQPANISAFDAVLMGRIPHMGARPSQDDIKKVDAVMGHLNLSAMGLTPLNQMSGGELQKVCIARALAQETDLLLMDEPTASLDLKNQARILALVRHIVKSHNMAAVLTLHDLNAALRYADRVLFLSNGQIAAEKQVTDVTPEIISQVYDMDVDMLVHQGLPLVVPRDRAA